jgi:hypothetical protein
MGRSLKELNLKLRITLLAVALLGAFSFAHAQEVEVTLTGVSCPLNTCAVQGSDSRPFEISFDVDTISTQQHFEFSDAQGVECVSEFDSSDLAISKFSASVNGQLLALPQATTGSFGMTLNSGSCTANSYRINIQVGNFAWSQSAGGTSISLSQLVSMYDPFESMLLGDYASGGDPAGGGSLPPDLKIRGDMSVSVVPVAEPDLWPLFAAALLGMAIAWRKRTTRRDAARS